MIKRQIALNLIKQAKKMPVVSVTGPRQSGKTTLVKSIFPQYAYTNLENPSVRDYAQNHPQEFLTQANHLIIDEAQRVPDLFSYIQTIVDESSQRRFILTGSQNFLLSKNISQSLAGRTSIFKLLPFSLFELQSTKYQKSSWFQYAYTGFYPRLYQKNIKPESWYPDYIESYLQRDVRQLSEITKLSSFLKFLKLCAGRIGQIVNYQSLANDCDISPNTAKAWLSVLEASYIIFTLEPYYKNLNKRLIKSPKLYFYDSGLACSLLGIISADQIKQHYLRGEIFESLIISELIKANLNSQKRREFYFFKDKSSHEVDLVFESALSTLNLIEIKSSSTVNSGFFKQLNYLSQLIKPAKTNRFLITAGPDKYLRADTQLIPWHQAYTILC